MGADWLSAFENVGGRLVPAARVFVDSEPPPRPSTGAPGIRWLATRLEDFVDRDTTDIEDDRFVEGAGALLGLLLIEHLGGRIRERGGSHRVQLGRFGWFDPFLIEQFDRRGGRIVDWDQRNEQNQNQSGNSHGTIPSKAILSNGVIRPIARCHSNRLICSS